jgi:hypothetical protein
VTEEGTVRSALSELSATTAPVVPLRLTVQTLELPVLNEFGLHVRLVIASGATTETVPPVPVIGIAVPVGAAETTLARPIGVVPGVVDKVNEIVATMPLEIVLLFIPVARHI